MRPGFERQLQRVHRRRHASYTKQRLAVETVQGGSVARERSALVEVIGDGGPGLLAVRQLLCPAQVRLLLRVPRAVVQHDLQGLEFPATAKQ